MNSNLNKIIQDNLDKSKFQSKKQPSLPKNTGWLDEYMNGGIYLSDRAKATQFGQYKKGGIIKDNRGQWAYPGEITEIDSDNITMNGVPYPVLGVGADGQQIMMQPGQDYRFNQGPVTEYPMAQNGGDISIPNLKNNWLTKYLKYK